jgi:superfamily II DNA or RNA helicase
MQELPGSLVHVRSRRCVVLDVVDHGQCRSVRVAPTRASDRGALTLLAPFDRIRPIATNEAPRRVGRRRAALAAVAAVAESHAAGELRAAVDADIRVLPYQLEPALTIVQGRATRLLLADEVGLGKTIQAGLILSELRAAGALTRALVLTPAGLRDQWSRELRDRFRLDTTLMDAPALAALGRSLPPSVNPWTLPGIALASIDLLKRGELLPQLEHVIWDAVIVDEAHHATNGTDRRAAAALTCARSRVVVLITATPHNGDGQAFADLCALGALDDEPLPIRVFRRTRQDISHDSQPRRVRRIATPNSRATSALHARLQAYTTRVWRESDGTDARLAMIVLRKRALSGPASLARSLARRLIALEHAGDALVSTQLSLDFGDTLDGELIADDDEPIAVLGAPGLTDAATERELLGELLEAARAALPFDGKAAILEKAIARTREPVIVFTEYRDTLEDLRRRLDGKVRAIVLHGGLLPSERHETLDAFASGAARVLLATDAAAEGLNLHHRCRWVVHYEAPWSPARVEQRNGRVDRLGQARRVHVWHLVASGTEESGILDRLTRRSEAAARDLATELAVARVVFGEEALEVSRTEFQRQAASQEALFEAQRVTSLKRLVAARRGRRGRSGRPEIIEETRPVTTRVGRRGSLWYVCRGHLLAVLRADALDARGHRIARFCAGVECQTLDDGRAAASRYFNAIASDSVALHRNVRALRQARDRAIANGLTRGPTRAVQPSLFDRRALLEAEHRRAALANALEELAEGRLGRDDFERTPALSIALVSVFAAG